MYHYPPSIWSVIPPPDVPQSPHLHVPQSPQDGVLSPLGCTIIPPRMECYPPIKCTVIPLQMYRYPPFCAAIATQQGWGAPKSEVVTLSAHVLLSPL